MTKIFIDNYNISKKNKPFFVAEISCNHGGSLLRAKRLIKAAKQSGADAVKFQLFSPDDMVLSSKNDEFVIKDKNSPWYNKTLYDLYSEAFTPKKWFKELFSYAKENKIICFSSVFNHDSVEFLEQLNTPAYKISSFEINHLPLIDKVSKTRKPIILSTGVADYKEIEEAIKVCKKNNNNKIIILKCSSEYPLSLKECNLNNIKYLEDRFNCKVGFSDHTDDLTAPIAAIYKGAVLIEKHFKMSDKDKVLDSKFSITPKEFSKLVKFGKNYIDTFGKKIFKTSKSVNFNKKFKRSIYISKNIYKGDRVSEKNIKIIRSNLGLHPKYYYQILNKSFKKKFSAGTPLKKTYIY